MSMKWSEYVKNVFKIKMFLKGLPRSGKTVLAASVTNLGPTLYIDLEGGLIAAKKWINQDNLDIEHIPTTDPRACTDAMNRAIEKAMSGKYEWVVMDSFTEFTGQLEDQYSKGEAGVKDWMAIIEKAKKVGRFFRDGDFHCIVTGLLKRDTAEPIMPGQTSIVIPSFFPIISMIQVKNYGKMGAKRILVSDPLSSKDVGDRYDILSNEEVIDEKNPEDVFKKLLKGIS
jgi:hypothetical protein